MLVGLVGVPNSGKSTFLKALTLKDVEIANYPFTTIKPNEAVGHVLTECPCKKSGVNCSPKNGKCVNGTRYVPVKILDVAGLVPGAHEGKGLGNQFLDDLRQASGLIHVLDCSGRTTDEGKPASGWDPMKTVATLENEIEAWLYGIIADMLPKLQTLSKMEKKPLEKLLGPKLSGLGIDEHDVKAAMLKAEPGTREFATEIRRVSKPILTAANKIDISGAEVNLERLREHIKYMVPTSSDCELALREAAEKGIISYIPGSTSFTVNGSANEKQRAALDFIRKNVMEKYGSTGVQQALNQLVFGLLDMVAVYPVANINKLSDTQGNVLPDVFLVRKGTTLKEVAGKVHTDLAEKFIGGLDASKRKIGADYHVQDGDVVEILFRH
jgi:hypothetical protein